MNINYYIMSYEKIKSILVENSIPLNNLDDINEIMKDIEIEDDKLYDEITKYYIMRIMDDIKNKEYGSRIYIKKMHKKTKEKIEEIADELYNNEPKLINEKIYNIMKKKHKYINVIMKMERDYDIDYFGMKTLEASYLLKNDNNIIERPQHLFMRVALGIHEEDMEKVEETYDLLSNRYYTHATPTLFNIGTNIQQLSSCYLLHIDDSIDDIFDKIKEIAMLSKWGGGIGVNLTAIRPKGSLIKGTNGKSLGVIPLCALINKEMKYINQGGKRQGSCACYMEPYHGDIYEFCELRINNSGNDDNRCRDLYLSLFIPDIFMERVEQDKDWTLMWNNQCKELNGKYGDEFNELYLKYEEEGKYKKKVRARDLWNHIIRCQLETGFPYMSYKDNANKKSNQKNVGIIRCSNLCNEIYEVTERNETAVCNLSSICLPKYIENKKINYKKLGEVVKIIVRNLNKVIDINYYPSKNAENGNIKHRPIGIGVQGLADVYNIMEVAYEDDEAMEINKRIFETIYYYALEESKNIAIKEGAYATFKGSPYSEGKLQYHLWGKETDELLTRNEYDWIKLIEDIKIYGTRNSLLTALMPTASTSQIMGNYESFEPYSSNIFIRTTMVGEYIIINENLVKKMKEINIWNEDMRKLIMINNGSIQNINGIPDKIKRIYKTAYEIPIKTILKQAIERGPFIDQSQSMNIFMGVNDYKRLSSSHFYGWRNGLKTGMYYLRTKAAVNPIKFGMDIKEIERLKNISETQNTKPILCKYNKNNKNKECLMCGS